MMSVASGRSYKGQSWASGIKLGSSDFRCARLVEAKPGNDSIKIFPSTWNAFDCEAGTTAPLD